MYQFSKKTHYSRRYSDFVGVDLSHDETDIAHNRMAYAQNVWRDYANENGGYVETFPGFRKIASYNGRVHGIFGFLMRGEQYTVVHAGTALYRFKESERDNASSGEILSREMADQDSTGFVMGNTLYILDGSRMHSIDEDGHASTVGSDGAYIPVTYSNDARYEQRNLLTDQTINRKHSPESQKGSLVASGSVRDEGQILYSDLICTNTGGRWQTLIEYGTWFYGDKTIRSVFLNEPDLTGSSYEDMIPPSTFEGSTLEKIILHAGSIDEEIEGTFTFGEGCFKNCKNLEAVYLQTAASEIVVGAEAFKGCGSFHVYTWRDSKPDISGSGASALKNATWHYGFEGLEEVSDREVTVHRVTVYDPALSVESVKVNGQEIEQREFAAFGSSALSFAVNYTGIGESSYVRDIVLFGASADSTVEVLLNCDPAVFRRFTEADDAGPSFSETENGYEGSAKDAVQKCRIAAIYDGRVFLTGNPDLPNTVFFSSRDITGRNNPTYVGIYNYVNDGIGNTPNVAMIASPYMLMVIKGDTTQDDGSVFYHTATDNTNATTADLLPRIYPSVQGVIGLGGVGAAINFMDDPVFLSKNGLNGVDKETVNLERSIGHRSTFVDRSLTMRANANARMTVWDGYLCILTDGGTIYLADSRQAARVDGSYQYEWFVLDGIGTYKGQHDRFFYRTTEYRREDSDGSLLYPAVMRADGSYSRVRVHPNLGGAYCDFEDVLETSLKLIDSEGRLREEDDSMQLYYVAEGGAYYIVDSYGEQYGGEFSPACNLRAVGDQLYFGTDSGDLCVVNTDKRGTSLEEGFATIPREWYTFDGRTIESGFSTVYDRSYYPDMSKNTVRKSVVLDTRNIPGSSFELLVRTDRTPWRSVVSATTGFAFDDFSFSGLLFSSGGTATLPVHEAETRWTKKQYYIKSAGYQQPFAINSIGYRYTVMGGVQ
jgi:hypothetical protein